MAENKQVAIYGKGGVGKSTVASNIAAAASHLGHVVLQVGCDPKSDSTANLSGGRMLPTILKEMRTVGISEETWQKVLVRGYNGIWCAEAGAPRPGVGCAGKGVAVALDMMAQYRIFDRLGVTLTIYDVLGDVSCGGFVQPMRRGYARDIYLVTSGDLNALYAANNVAKAVELLVAEGADCALGGIIHNMNGAPEARDLVEDFARVLGVPVVAHIPRSGLVSKAEMEHKTVVEAYPESSQAQVYRDLAQRIIDSDEHGSAKSLEMEDLLTLVARHRLTSL